MWILYQINHLHNDMTQSEFPSERHMQLELSGKPLLASHVWFCFHFLLVGKLTRGFSANHKAQNQSNQNSTRNCSYPGCQRLYMRGSQFLSSLHSRDFKIQRGDSNKNVAKKVNLRSFSLYSDYSYPLTLSKVGEPSWSWDFKWPYPSSEREINFRRRLLRSP